MCFLFKQKGIPMTHAQKNKILDTNHKNSNATKNNDNDVMYEMECCNPSDEELDEILLSSDSEDDEETESEV